MDSTFVHDVHMTFSAHAKISFPNSNCISVSVLSLPLQFDCLQNVKAKAVSQQTEAIGIPC